MEAELILAKDHGAARAASDTSRDFEAFVTDEKRLALAIAHSHLRDWEEARDAVQDAFVKAYTKWDALKDEYWRSHEVVALPPSKRYGNGHECGLCVVVGARMLSYYGKSYEHMNLVAWQEERLKSAPQNDEMTCFVQKTKGAQDTDMLRDYWKEVYS